MAGGVVVVLGLAQLLLPGLAAQRVRDELSRYGTVRSATINAFPAVELLWGHAQSATVTVGQLDMGLSQASELLSKATGVGRIDMTAESMRLGSLTMSHAVMEKRGEELYIRGAVGQADLLAGVPGAMAMQLIGRVPGGVEVRVTGSLFGVASTVDALLSIQEGKLVAQPQGIPFAGFIKLTLLSDPRIDLQAFDLSPAAASAGGSPVYLARIWAKLR
jgi:hypothetical protein